MTMNSNLLSSDSAKKAAEVERLSQKKDVRNRWLISLPALAIIFFAAAGPLVIVVLYSFLTPGDYTGVIWTFTTETWISVVLERDFFDDTLYVDQAKIVQEWAMTYYSIYNEGAFIKLLK